MLMKSKQHQPSPRKLVKSLSSVPYGVPGVTPITYDFNSKDGLKLKLTRFCTEPAKQVVLLAHGLASSSLKFGLGEHENLITYLHNHGWTDVWCLDNRTSSLLPHNTSATQWNFDDLVLNDVPAAMAALRELVDDKPIHVLAHCIGGLMFSMALAAGVERDLKSYTSLSLSLCTRLPAISNAKLLFLSDIMRERFNMNYLPIDVNDVGMISKAGAIFATAGLTRHECQSPTCHMLNFAMGDTSSALFDHTHLDAITHSRLTDFFGPVPLCYFPHLRKMLLSGVAVKFDSNNAQYAALPDNYFASAGSIQTPMHLVSGTENKLWLDSTSMCYDMLMDYHPHLNVKQTLIPQYGHMDIIIGKHAAIDTFPQIVAFLDENT